MSVSNETPLTPYLQLARVGRYPVGTLKVFWPAAWAAVMAAYRVGLNGTDLAKNVAGIAVASSLVHTTICTLNDICDRNIDANIERCKKRPLPSGRVSLKAAVIFLLAQTAGCLALLKTMVRDDVIPLGLIGLFPLHGLYPLMKRITYWPQVWLGLSGAAGAAVCWKQIVGEIDPYVIIPSSIAMVCWTIHFDTVYASQDRKDDKENGVGSTAVLFGDHIRGICGLFAFAFVALMAFAGYSNMQGPLYFIGAIGSAAIHLTWQLTTVDFDRKGDGMRMFVANGTMGYYMFAGMLADWAYKVYA